MKKTEVDLVSLIEDINRVLSLDEELSIDGTEEEMIMAIKDAIDDFGGFIEKDFEPGKKTSLKIQSVFDLQTIGVDIPKTWIKRAEKASKAKAKKASKAPTYNFLGHRLNADNSAIDEAMLAGPFKIEDLVTEKWSKGRISNHLAHLKRDKSDLVEVTKNEAGENIVKKR